MNKDELKELAATLNGIADGKKWEYQVMRNHWKESTESECPISAIESGFLIRLKPWKLPDPPEGMEWHREDWTEEMLPEGWRPLLLDEIECNGDEYLSTTQDGVWNRTPCAGSHVGVIRTRTKRPLLQPKATPVLVPLGPEDVPPGSVVRLPLNESRWYFVISVGASGIVTSSDSLKSFKSMMDGGWRIKRPGEDWQPCSKEAQP